MEHRDVATIAVIYNDAAESIELLDSLKDKIIFINIKNRDKENPIHTTSTFKITNVIHEDNNMIGLVGDSHFISLTLERVFELIRYGRATETEHRKTDALIKTYYIIA